MGSEEKTFTRHDKATSPAVPAGGASGSHARLLIPLMLAAVLTGVFATGAAALPGLIVLPADTLVCLEDVFTMEVYIDTAVVNLMGWDVVVEYDETQLEVVGVSEGSLPADSGHPTFFCWLDEGDVDGTVHVNGSILGKTVDSPGVLFTIEFRAVAVGASAVCITDSELRNNLNRSIGHSVECGSVMVEPPISSGSASWGRIKATARK